MGKAKLRQKLESLPKENIVRVVMSLYDASKEARQYLDFYAEPNSKDECERFKQVIRKEFFPSRGFSEKPSFATCRKAISDFKKMKPQPYYLADLMLFYIENGCEYTMTYGDMWNNITQHSKTISTKPWSILPRTVFYLFSKYVSSRCSMLPIVAGDSLIHCGTSSANIKVDCPFPLQAPLVLPTLSTKWSEWCSAPIKKRPWMPCI